jgi:hypothetical protein
MADQEPLLQLRGDLMLRFKQWKTLKISYIVPIK